MGEQLLANLLVLFLGEPTPALDATSGFQIAKLIPDLAEKKGMTIICNIHQLSEFVLACAGNLLLASRGRQADLGKLDAVLGHFEGFLELENEPGIAVAEWITECLSKDTGEEKAVAACLEAWEQAPGYASALPTGTLPLRCRDLVVPSLVFTARALLNTLRNPMVIWLHYGMYNIALSVLIGWKSGEVLTAGEVTDAWGVLFFVPAFMAVLSISVLPAFFGDSTIPLKGRASASYDILSCSISAFPASTPLTFLLTASCGLTCHFSLNFESSDGKPLFLVLGNLFTLLCSESSESIVYRMASGIPIFILAITSDSRKFRNLGAGFTTSAWNSIQSAPLCTATLRAEWS